MRSDILITGYSGAGKSTLAFRLAKKRGSSCIELGNYVRSAHRAVCSTMSLVDFADESFRRFGPTCFVERAQQDRAKLKQVVWVGARRPEEVRWLQQQGSLVHVWLDADVDLRRDRQRLKSSPKFDAELRDVIEESWGFGQLRGMADVVISAASAYDDILDQLEVSCA